MGTAATVASRVDTRTSSFRRAERWQALTWLWKHSSIERVRKCSRVAIDKAGVSIVVSGPEGNRTAGVGGVHHCGSVWACPQCASKVTAERAEKVSTIIDAAVERGLEPLFVTLTVRHNVGQSLEQVWDGVNAAWHKVISGAQWTREQLDYGVVMPKMRAKVDGPQTSMRIPAIRALDVTVGYDSGWHPHIHAVLFVRKGISDDELGRWLYFKVWPRWNAGAQSVGLDAGDPWLMNVQRVSEAGALGEYFNKLQYRSVALEMVAGGFKVGRGEHWTPFQVLGALVAHASGVAGAHLTAQDRRRFGAMWREWEQTSRGRRQLIISQGFVKWLELDELREDQEIVDDDMGGVTMSLIGQADRTAEERVPVPAGSVGPDRTTPALSAPQGAGGSVVGLEEVRHGDEQRGRLRSERDDGSDDHSGDHRHENRVLDGGCAAITF